MHTTEGSCMSIASTVKMPLNAAVLCLLILSAASAVGTVTESAQVNVISTATTTEYQAQSTYPTTTPEIIMYFFNTTQITTSSITPIFSTTTPPITTAPPTASTTFRINTPPMTTRFSATLPSTTTMFTITTPATTAMFTITTPATTTMFTTTSPTITAMFTTTPPPIATIMFTTTTSPTITTMFTTTPPPIGTAMFTTTPPPIGTTMFTTTPPPIGTTMFTTTPPPIGTTMFTTTTSPVTTTMFTTTTPPITTRTETTTTRTTQNLRPAQCHNGGYFDGIGCVCLGDFYGAFCEFIPNRIILGTTMTAQVNVQITFTDLVFTADLIDPTSQEFKRFESDFKLEMNVVYGVIPGYKDVIIQGIRSADLDMKAIVLQHWIRTGSVIVSHNVLVEIEHKLNQNITHVYNQILQMVIHLLEEHKSKICTAANSWCFDVNSIMAIPPPSGEELCMGRVPEGNAAFYSPVFSPDGLVCISHCDPHSPKYLNCNDGTCQIRSRSGPQCFCARTDLYIYGASQCTGAISKLGLFIGAGVTIGILFIVSIILGIYIYVVKRSLPKPFLSDDLYCTTII